MFTQIFAAAKLASKATIDSAYTFAGMRKTGRIHILAMSIF